MGFRNGYISSKPLQSTNYSTKRALTTWEQAQLEENGKQEWRMSSTGQVCWEHLMRWGMRNTLVTFDRIWIMTTLMMGFLTAKCLYLLEMRKFGKTRYKTEETQDWSRRRPTSVELVGPKTVGFSSKVRQFYTGNSMPGYSNCVSKGNSTISQLLATKPWVWDKSNKYCQKFKREDQPWRCPSNRDRTPIFRQHLGCW